MQTRIFMGLWDGETYNRPKGLSIHPNYFSRFRCRFAESLSRANLGMPKINSKPFEYRLACVIFSGSYFKK